MVFPHPRSGGSIVNNMLDYQSRDCKINPHFSGLPYETLNRGPVSISPFCWRDVKSRVQSHPPLLQGEIIIVTSFLLLDE